ncbi:Hypothetical predicted protein [Olea europaea subsp. europaea]|uniref:Uncharacterized protein n=1 Tax=Olea europaea subsp. europaea TaxID=158383 RepID=A0A8S0RQI4_OLEEU|nr:Hypothetical predicted protein [Olea europaea subsp. europaea]
MGNCMNKCTNNNELMEKKAPQAQEKKSEEIQKENGSKMTVKIMLTKEELQWLLFQQKHKEWKSLEDVLGEIQKVRKKANFGWKPSLDSINESPCEVLEEGVER